MLSTGPASQNLSGGQKQKVAIAGILAMDVPILLFDEPLPISIRPAEKGDGNHCSISCQNGQNHRGDRAQDRRRAGSPALTGRRH
jgi:hypothetical protein